MFKVCTKCGIEKSHLEFYNSSAPCKQCEKERSKTAYCSKYKFSRKKIQKEVKCPGCKVRFTPERKDNIFCSKDCKLKNWLSGDSEKVKLHKVKTRIRNCIRRGVLNNSETKSEQLFGCSWPQLKSYLEKTYIDKYGEEPIWNKDVHIDHISPLSLADNEEEAIKLSHYSNLRLLKAHDNLVKNSKTAKETK